MKCWKFSKVVRENTFRSTPVAAIKKIILFSTLSFLLGACRLPETQINLDDNDSPCNSQLMYALEKKMNLTSEETKIYLELKKMCEDKKNAYALEQQLNQLAKSALYFRTLSIISLILSAALLLLR